MVTSNLNDPVFFESADGSWSQVGHIDAVSSVDPSHFTMSWYGMEFRVRSVDLTAYHNSGRLDDVIATMFPAGEETTDSERLERSLGGSWR